MPMIARKTEYIPDALMLSLLSLMQIDRFWFGSSSGPTCISHQPNANVFSILSQHSQLHKAASASSIQNPVSASTSKPKAYCGWVFGHKVEVIFHNTLHSIHFKHENLIQNKPKWIWKNIHRSTIIWAQPAQPRSQCSCTWLCLPENVDIVVCALAHWHAIDIRYARAEVIG